MTDPLPGRPGIDVPDHRGRTGLDRTGRSLDRNPDVRVTDVELVAAAWHVLRRTTLEYRTPSGKWETQQRETYDRGNGATVLLYDPARRTVLLTRQFRYPVYVNGHPDGMLIETAAGLLDDDDPATAIRREAAEETGVEIGELEHVWDVFMSPGSVTERIHFFAAPYDGSARTGDTGGLAHEGEHIELLELGIEEALAQVRDGRIQDAKTIMLLQWAVLEGPFGQK
jgi:nudix-type nucleoside diphosphatase (YffH/AdpP family)